MSTHIHRSAGVEHVPQRTMRVGRHVCIKHAGWVRRVVHGAYSCSTITRIQFKRKIGLGSRGIKIKFSYRIFGKFILKLNRIRKLNSEWLPCAVVIGKGISHLCEDVFFDIIFVDGGDGTLCEPVGVCLWLEAVCKIKAFQTDKMAKMKMAAFAQKPELRYHSRSGQLWT